MINWFKKLSIPNGEKTEVVAYNSWVVRWEILDVTRYDWGTYSLTHFPSSEIFPSESDAYKFADQLREAQKLLRYKGSGLKVTVEANQNKIATLAK